MSEQDVRRCLRVKLGRSALVLWFPVSPKLGEPFGGPKNKDASLLGSTLGWIPPYFGELPHIPMLQVKCVDVRMHSAIVSDFVCLGNKEGISQNGHYYYMIPKRDPLVILLIAIYLWGPSAMF